MNKTFIFFLSDSPPLWATSGSCAPAGAKKGAPIVPCIGNTEYWTYITLLLSSEFLSVPFAEL